MVDGARDECNGHRLSPCDEAMIRKRYFGELSIPGGFHSSEILRERSAASWASLTLVAALARGPPFSKSDFGC
jgi:hypothetical protein